MDEKTNVITQKVYKAAVESLGNKLDKVILYGSYARGDYTQDSDIDIITLANINADETWKTRMDISRLIDGIDLEYNILVSLHVVDCMTFNKYADCLPFYMNILSDGVVINAG